MGRPKKSHSVVPDQIPTGIDQGAIGFHSDVFMGDPNEFSFDSQQENYERLCEALDRNNMRLNTLGVGKSQTFVAVVGTLEEPLFIWERFVGRDANNTENVVYFNGMKMQLDSFLKKPDAEQDKLLEPLIMKAWMV